MFNYLCDYFYTAYLFLYKKFSNAKYYIESQNKLHKNSTFSKCEWPFIVTKDKRCIAFSNFFDIVMFNV